MSTTDAAEICRLGQLVIDRVGHAVECPVPGRLYRAATGNISIFAACDRPTFERVLPLLTVMGRERAPHRGARDGVDVEGDDELSGDSEPVGAHRGVDDDGGRRGRPCDNLRGDPHLERQLVRARDREPVDPQRFTRHRLHDRPRIERHRAVPEHRRTVGCAARTEPTHDRHLRRWPPAIWGRRVEREIVRRLEETTGLSITAAGFPAELVDNEPEVRGAEVRRQRVVQM